jgi:hypothetical protein
MDYDIQRLYKALDNNNILTKEEDYLSFMNDNYNPKKPYTFKDYEQDILDYEKKRSKAINNEEYNKIIE